MSDYLFSISNTLSILEFTYVVPLVVFISEFILSSIIILVRKRATQKGAIKNMLLRLFVFSSSRVIGIVLFIIIISSIRAFDYFILDLINFLLILIPLSIVINSIFIVSLEGKEFAKALKISSFLLALFSSLMISLMCIVIVYSMGV